MPGPTITYDDEAHAYTINGEDVPSVTQILDRTTPKDALTWWGMRVGIAGVIRLLQTDKLNSIVLPTYNADDHLSGVPSEGEEFVLRGKGSRQKKKTPLEALMISEKLTTNHVRDAKGDLGTATHNAIETISLTGDLPSLADYPPEIHGYLRAMSRWYSEQDPEFLEQEVIVASETHMYAGRFDIVTMQDGKRGLWDFKTSKGVYESMSEQIMLYALAYDELFPDAEPFDEMGIIHLMPDGKYKRYPAYTGYDTAIHAVELFHSRNNDKARQPAAWKN